MDSNLDRMSREDLMAVIQELRDGIRNMDIKNQHRWILLGVAALTVPLPFTDFLVMSGIAPLLGIAMLSYWPLIWPFLFGYCAAFYFIGGLIARLLTHLPLKARRYTLAAAVIGLLILGFFPLHWAGHGRRKAVTAYEFYFHVW